jgi:virginiamycin B lyase
MLFLAIAAVTIAGCGGKKANNPPSPSSNSIVLFPFPAGVAGPNAIAAGPSNSNTVWFGTSDSGSGPSAVGFTNLTGHVTTFLGGVQPGLTDDPFGYFGITTGPDGNIWFAEAGNSVIARITPGGGVTETQAAGVAPFDVTTGPDGAMWYTLNGSAAIGRITTAPVPSATAYPIPNPKPQATANVQAIVEGGDKNLYFTDCGAQGGGVDGVGQVIVTSAGPRFGGYLPVPTQGSCPQGIVSGGGNVLWFMESSQQNNVYNVARLVVQPAFSSSTITQFRVPAPPGNLAFLAAAGGGSTLYLADGGASPGLITRVTGLPAPTSSAAPTYKNTAAGQQPEPIALGPDGNVWFGSPSVSGIGKLIVPKQ